MKFSNFVEKTDSNDRHSSVEHVVADDEDVVIHTLSRESAIHGEPELHEGEGEVLVEEVAQEERHPMVRPVAVQQQKPLQVVELRNAVVTAQNRLHPFLPWVKW